MTQTGGERVLLRPPVIEKAMGIEFSSIPRWAAPHLGLLWAELKADYPDFEMQPPLPSQVEQLGDKAIPTPGISVEFGDPFRFRTWFVSADRSRLLQVQDNRLIFNWRKLKAADPYPHYRDFKPLFCQEWERFEGFVAGQGLSALKPIQCELTYVNHVARGSGWSDYEDLGKVLRPWQGISSGSLKTEAVTWNARLLLPDGIGRLHVALQPVMRISDGTEALQLNLTARGAPFSEARADVIRWFDLAHDALVQAFFDMTTPEMHALWNAESSHA